MEVFEKIKELKQYLASAKKSGKSIGFVPTMGALHLGHIALINESKQQNDITVCSVFVNPTQFNDKTDLDKYPRTLEADKKLLEAAQCDVLFAPSVNEIYPVANNSDEQKTINVNLGLLDKVMEGAMRPGHFRGVIQVVSRLFDIVEPNKAYFGQKDFQQLAVIKAMTKQLNYPVDIVGCSIVRENDGLAMSSRNVRLNADERAAAPLISKTLFKVKELADKLSSEELKILVAHELADSAHLKLEYFEIVNSETLQPINKPEEVAHSVACIAVWAGKVRLIDNVILY